MSASPALCCLRCRRERRAVSVGTNLAGRPMLACEACLYPLWRRPDHLASGPLSGPGPLANEPAVRVAPAPTAAPAAPHLTLVSL